MPTSPNTPGILAQLVTMGQGIQVSSSTFFQASSVTYGKYKDVTNVVPCLEFTMADDISTRLTLGNGITQGGKVDDGQYFLAEITLDLTDSVAVELQLAQVRDAISKLFHGSATLNLPGVQYSGWHGDGTEGYSNRNGVWWRNFRRKIKVRFDYSVTIVP